MTEIHTMQKQADSGKINPKDLKARLARSIVTDFWGESAARNAELEFERVFAQREVPTEMEEIGIPKQGTTLLDLLTDNNLLPSRGEAKRLIRQGGVYVNGQRAEDIALKLEIIDRPEIIVKIGKKRFYRIVKI